MHHQPSISAPLRRVHAVYTVYDDDTTLASPVPGAYSAVDSDVDLDHMNSIIASLREAGAGDLALFCDGGDTLARKLGPMRVSAFLRTQRAALRSSHSDLIAVCTPRTLRALLLPPRHASGGALAWLSLPHQPRKQQLVLHSVHIVRVPRSVALPPRAAAAQEDEKEEEEDSGVPLPPGGSWVSECRPGTATRLTLLSNSSAQTASGGGGETAYLNLLRDILQRGTRRADRTAVGTLSMFGRQLRFDLSGGRFPMLTTRRVSFDIVVKELLWIVSGCTDSRALEGQGVRIWRGNTTREFLDGCGLRDLPEGDIGAAYGFQLRHAGAAYSTCRADYAGQGVDQLAEVLRLLREDPDSRRICMTAWNPVDLPRMALPPCHACFVQFRVDSERRLSCMMTQRSVDTFLGLAINIPSYALLTNILAAMAGMEPGELVINTGDTHLYLTHLDQARLQLTRAPLPAPLLRVNPSVRDKTFEDLRREDFELLGYFHHPAIKAEMAV